MNTLVVIAIYAIIIVFGWFLIHQMNRSFNQRVLIIDAIYEESMKRIESGDYHFYDHLWVMLEFSSFEKHTWYNIIGKDPYEIYPQEIQEIIAKYVHGKPAN